MRAITDDEVRLRLALDNPWWRDAKQFGDGIAPLPRRDLFQGFYGLLSNAAIKRAPVLMGPRRVGKSVMLHQSIAQLLVSGIEPARILYASLDTPIYTDLSLEALLRIQYGNEGLLDRTPHFIFFDEIQYLKDWERHLKSLVDALPKWRFVASGSAAAALRLKSTESGAGRFTDYYLPGLSFAEFLRFTGTTIPADRKDGVAVRNSAFVDYINYGGFPELALSPDMRSQTDKFVRADILDKVLLRDLPGLYGIHDTRELHRLFATLAYNTGQEVSLDGLAQTSGVAKNTLRRYLSYLEAAFLIVRVPRIDLAGKRFKREVAFKVHLTIPSLRAALYGPLNGDEEVFGDVVDTTIVAQWAQTRYREDLSYARWDKGEIDLVLTHGPRRRPNLAIEAKWSDRIARHPEELQPQLDFIRRNKMTQIIVTTRSVEKEITFEGVKIRFLPAAIAAQRPGSGIALNARISLNADAFRTADTDSPIAELDWPSDEP